MVDKRGAVRLFGMEDKVVVVTGGATGIGRGAAEIFSEAGATVVIVDTDVAGGEKAVAELETNGSTAVFFQADVASKMACELAMGSVLEHFGRLDVLVSNAGIYPLVPLDRMTEDNWDRVFAVNVKGMFFMVAAALPSMRLRRYGRVVLTSSVIGALTGTRGGTHYGASKAAILGFMRSAAIEVADCGITVNAVLPGYILTEGARAAQSQQRLDEASASIPLQRQGSPKDIGYAMLFLASDEAEYITGQTLVVDGGLTLVT